ncbi:MAG: slipin family protein [Bacteroidales bacterium]|nr:slipin family protein [Bacteroidales bacterium]
MILEIIALAIIIAILALSVKIVKEWERIVVLQFGKFKYIGSPGINVIIPLVQTVAYVIDFRVKSSGFTAEQTLTKDTVPVNVNAILFWNVENTTKAALEVENYSYSVNLAAQTALRDVIGKTNLADMLSGREVVDKELQHLIESRVAPWGVKVLSVEISDVVIPDGLQNAMSMQAQAERERQARVILGESERQVAQSFSDAAKQYQDNPVALHLRAMNMLYEGIKSNKSTIIMVPSSALSTMDLGSATGAVNLAKNMPGLESNK